MGPSMLNLLRVNEHFRVSVNDGRACALTYSVLKNLHSRAANEYIIRNEGEEASPLACTNFSEPDLRDLLAVADEDGTVHMLRTHQPGNRLALETSFQAHENAIFDMCTRPGRRHLATAGGDLAITLWDLDHQTEVSRFKAHTGSVKCVHFLPGQSDVFASGSRDGAVMVWDTRCSEPQVTIPRAHCTAAGPLPSNSRNIIGRKVLNTPCSVTACAFRDEHYLVTCAANNREVKVWDLRKNYQLFKNDPRPVTAFPYAGRSKAIHGYTSMVLDQSRRRAFVNCTDHNIYEFDLLASNTSEPLRTYCGHSIKSFYVKLALSCDGRYLASGSSDSAAYIWQVGSPGFPKLRLPGHEGEVAVLAWDASHPARLATCGDDFRVLLWDAAGGEDTAVDCTRAEVFTFIESADPPVSASPSSSRLVPPHPSTCSLRTPTRRKASVADWLTPPTKRRLTGAASTTPGAWGHGPRVECDAVSPDGDSLPRPSPPADLVLSPRKKVDNAFNLPQRRLLPHLNALENGTEKDASVPDSTACDLENWPLQALETPPRPAASSETKLSAPSASRSRKQHKVMTRLFKRQTLSAVDKGKSKAKRVLLSTQQQITSFFKR
ncbi:denticleless protein homolog isoform X1 [Dermacentor andersoni]|uniref:denticleless protein homolog isoform X1 n=1 Tax=Dermacentor andersoni TaxID=34620 RepID=UPI002415AEB7|nr:denticleless protein homolog isoform X1 [Dermacentor andersoni]